MPATNLILAIITISLLSLGQIVFKLASEELELSRVGFFRSLFGCKIILAIAIYAVASVLWMVTIKNVPLSTAYPFAALAFVFVPMMAFFVLGEPLGLNKVVGAFLIISGVVVSVRQGGIL